MEEILRLERLSKIYGQGNSVVQALNNVSFSISTNSFTALVGRSGSGKSTLLNCIGGLEEPTSGQVLISGENLYSMSNRNRTIFRRRKIGYVFQFFNLLSEMNVWENVCIPAYIDNRRPDENYAKTVINQLGLSEKTNRYPSELSGGEQQRVAVARALIMKPDILLADEPTGNLDKKTGDELLDILLFSHKYFEQTVLLVTHDLDIARKSERIITLEDGCIISDTLGARI